MAASERGPTWTKLLHAAERGDGVETRALAVRLAREVLSSPTVTLAHEVLAGGPYATAKAIELAEHLLNNASPSLASLPVAARGAMMGSQPALVLAVTVARPTTPWKKKALRVELTGIEPHNGHFTKLSAHAVLAENSRKSLGKPLPFGPVGYRPVPSVGAESRQPDGNASGG